MNLSRKFVFIGSTHLFCRENMFRLNKQIVVFDVKLSRCICLSHCYYTYLAKKNHAAAYGYLSYSSNNQISIEVQVVIFK